MGAHGNAGGGEVDGKIGVDAAVEGSEAKSAARLTRNANPRRSLWCGNRNFREWFWRRTDRPFTVRAVQNGQVIHFDSAI